MKTNPTPETSSFLSGFKGNMIIAGAFGIFIFLALWLHDALILGLYAPSGAMFIFGVGTFLLVLGATAVSSSKSLALAFLLVLVLLVYFFPAENHELSEAKDAVAHLTPTTVTQPEISPAVQPEVPVLEPEVPQNAQ